MILTQFLRWWYGSGWMSAGKELVFLLRRTAGEFSLGILLRTLYSPWKRTINLAGPNTPINVRIQWWIGNQISRFIGLLIRLITLCLALVLMVVISALGLAGLVLWPLLPIGWLISLIMGISL